MDMRWQDHWDQTRQRHIDWWAGDGGVVWVMAPADQPHADIPKPVPPPTLETQWLDPVYRARKAEYELSRTFFGGDAVAYFDAHIGPGNLATFLGSPMQFSPDTVWYEPCMDDLEAHPKLKFDPNHPSFRKQLAIIEQGLRIADNRFLVGMPDLIENIDTLASLRGCQQVLFDMLEQPAAVKRRLAEINQVYFDAFDAIYARIKDEHGGNAFSAFYIWGPGKTAKVQCDASAMFSPEMYAEFVIPSLRQQCAWLDYCIFHLDGTHCIHHLDHLLAIEDLHAVQWTPQAGIDPSGAARWYPLYRKILDGGKRAQALNVAARDVVPLLQAVGSKGMYIGAWAESESEARDVLAAAERYR